MTTYHATYRNNVCFAEAEIEAATAEEALTKARALFDADPLGLDWRSYDGDANPDEIEITGPEEGDTALWQCDYVRLCDSARDLFDALQEAVNALNTAPRLRVVSTTGEATDSYAIAALCDRALASARPQAE